MIRAFIALPVVDAAKQGVLKAIDSLKASAGSDTSHALSTTRWVEKNNIHLTLKFLGMVNDQQVQRAKEAMDTLKCMSAFRIVLQDIGAFPSLARPRVLWIGIKQFEQVKALFDKIEESLRDINREDRPFSAHLTIGRAGRLAGANNHSPLLEKVKKLWDGKTIGNSIVDRVVLFQSILGPNGAVYRPLYEVELKKEAL